MKIIRNPTRVRQHKHVLTEKAENECQSYASNIVFGTLASYLKTLQIFHHSVLFV